MPGRILCEVPRIEKPAVEIRPKPACLDCVLDAAYQAELARLLLMHELAPQMHFILERIIGSLPTDHPWLDSEVEALARKILQELEAIKHRRVVPHI